MQHPGIFAESLIGGAFQMMLGTGWREFMIQFLGPDMWEVSVQGGPTGDLLKLPLTQYIQKWIIKNPGWFLIQITAECFLLFFYGNCFLALWLSLKAGNSRVNYIQHVHMFIWMVILYLFSFLSPLIRSHTFDFEFPSCHFLRYTPDTVVLIYFQNGELRILEVIADFIT